MKIMTKFSAVLVASAILLTGCGSDGGSLSDGSTATSSVTSQISVGSSDTASTTTASADISESTQPTEGEQTSSADIEEISQPQQTAVSSAQTTADTAATEDSSQPQETAPAEQGITVTYAISNTWQEEGKQCSQLDFTVKSPAYSAVEGWSITVDFGQEADPMQQWNVNITNNGNSFNCTNADYNGNIAAGAETTFGIIVKTPQPIDFVSITADGKQVSGTPQQSNSEPQQTVASTTSAKPAEKPDLTPEEVAGTGSAVLVSEGGQLSVKGTDLVDRNGKPIQLRGVSTHGVQWFPQFVNKNVFRELRDEWNVNVVRLAMYSGAGEGYTDSTKAGIEQTVQNAVDACIELDMYVIIDWHVLQDQSPQVRKADALRFFNYMSERYADYPNVIYEICNEPNGYASWEGDIKPYAEEVIPVIRANDPDSVIIVGTPTWSQDIDKALGNPLKYDNVMYALHYYAATHTDWLRDRVKNCYNSGLPIFVSEFGNCDASGGGANNWNEAQKWFDLLDELNISYVSWALADKAETCCMLKPNTDPNGNWTDNDLTENGKHMKDWFKYHK